MIVMDHYIDIKVLPDPEFNATTLMNALYAKLHRALVNLQSDSLGVSFPEAKKTPGSLLRLHGSNSNLVALMRENWLLGLRDYTLASDPMAVPAKTQLISVRRIQNKLTAARIRRALTRNCMTQEKAEQLLNSRQLLKLPYLQLKSQSTGQVFPLHFEQKKAGEEVTTGKFNAYGFSQTATLPWF